MTRDKLISTMFDSEVAYKILAGGDLYENDGNN